MRSAERTTHRVSERTPYITLVGKVVQIIEALRDAPEGLALQALARRTGYVKSSIHRILLSLRQHGYVQQDEPGGPYRLGLKFVAIGRAVNGNVSLVQVVRPHLRELVAAFDESAYLAVLRGERGIFVDVQETNRDLRLVGPLGAEVHFHATAAGKVIAALFPADRRAALLARLSLTRLTPRTITSRAEVERQWTRVRRLGIAVNHEETIVGAVFLAAPIFDVEPHVCGAISIGIPKARFSATLGRAMAAALKDTCARLSETLAAAGYTHRVGAAPRPVELGETTRSTLAG
ncbi:MAG: helix-turn-helix domain-containing protein [Luteitalea sp.]|nr:helix-turn-helix domain-containing protein [Luteitalea sp.]